jgi:SAM-dependent methyltransferase
MKDKVAEAERYNSRAKKLFFSLDKTANNSIDTLPSALSAPYEFYECTIKNILNDFPNSLTLELGAGMGEHTNVLIENSCAVIATDISRYSLEILKLRYEASENLETRVCDIELLPFKNSIFDLVVGAGILSYGDNDLVMKEVFRVLKPGGYFVCVDSLNHNIFFRVNRYLHFLRGNRTISTLRRMPTLSLITGYSKFFGSADAFFFGALTFMLPVILPILGNQNSKAFLSYFDKFKFLNRYSFKFVMIAKKVN